MIKKILNLNSAQKEMLESLLNECSTHDGNLVPLQFDHSLNFYKDLKSWFLSFEHDQIIGVLSVFCPLSNVAEISACIKPVKRNAGRFNELLLAATEELKKTGIEHLLFVVDANSQPAMKAIEHQGLKRDHVEYLMRYEVFHAEYPSIVHIRQAEKRDMVDFVRISSVLFHDSQDEAESIFIACLKSTERTLYLAEVNKETVGVFMLSKPGVTVTINGLGICEEHQGKGYGRGLVNAILNLFKDANCVLELEVDSLNDRAHKLYKKAGFVEQRAVNYYEKSIL
jgi:ribosomal protein S18 acetylase RimI-like enzyme